MDIIFSSVTQLAAAIRARQISSVEVLDAHLAQIARHNPALNAIVTLDAEQAQRQAHAADEALARGEVAGPVHGVPFTLKDAFATAGMRTTTGSPLLDHVPAVDSTVAARLKAAGGILMGKTNVAEMLGDPAQTNNPIFGRTNNPWDIRRTPCGSSGGAAAAVAAGMTPFDIGTDLAGSTRIPAHFCGVVGLKPTEHRVSLAGLIPGLPTPPGVRIMSCIGPLARTVEDVALLYRIIAGPDGCDTDVPPVPAGDEAEVALRDVRIAFAPSWRGIPVADKVRATITELAERLQRSGAVVEEVALPEPEINQVLAQAGELIGMMLGAFQPGEQATPATLAGYLTALHLRDRSINAWEQFFETWDVLLCPPAMTNAFPHCETGAPLQVDGQERPYWLINAYTVLFNYTGHPAVVMPYRCDAHGLPTGIQLAGKRWGEARLLSIAGTLTGLTVPFQRPPGY